jgi:hypothetical protein
MPSEPYSLIIFLLIQKFDEQSLPFQQTRQTLLDLALRLVEVNDLNLLVEFLNVRVLGVLLEVDERLDHLDQVLLLRAFETANAIAELELVAGDGLLDKGLPVVVVDLVKVKLSLNLATAVLDILFVGEELRHDEFNVSSGNLLNFLVLGVAGELIEVESKFHEIRFAFDVVAELFHIMIGLLADDEECNSVVGVDIVEAVDVGGDVFEDEHDVVSAVEVELLVFFNVLGYLLLLLVLLHQLLDVD